MRVSAFLTRWSEHLEWKGWETPILLVALRIFGAWMHATRRTEGQHEEPGGHPVVGSIQPAFLIATDQVTQPLNRWARCQATVAGHVYTKEWIQCWYFRARRTKASLSTTTSRSSWWKSEATRSDWAWKPQRKSPSTVGRSSTPSNEAKAKKLRKPNIWAALCPDAHPVFLRFFLLLFLARTRERPGGA